MPEAPELRYACNFVNKVCKDIVFGGKPVKSEVSKNSEVNWSAARYVISAKARGKEVMLLMEDETKPKKPDSLLKIIFHFGMSGNFSFTNSDNIPKHAHFRFYTVDEKPQKVLSFVDVRRFGSWAVVNDWSPNRGPDPVYEYEAFRENVLSNLDNNVFKKPICEAMLDQKYFNGIGNYLRAEILYRAGIKPFERAITVLEKLGKDSSSVPTRKIKEENPDVLQLCHDVIMECINLNVSPYNPQGDNDHFEPFINWLQCYFKIGMYHMKDHNKRTIWFEGKDSGPLAPKKETPVQKVDKSPSSTPKKKGNNAPKSPKKVKLNIKKVEDDSMETEDSGKVVNMRRSARIKTKT